MARAIREATIGLLVVLVWGSAIVAPTMLLEAYVGWGAALSFMVLAIWATCVLIALEDW